jgi:thiol-disulfide isomerase/thioredoxin
MARAARRRAQKRPQGFGRRWPLPAVLGVAAVIVAAIVVLFATHSSLGAGPATATDFKIVAYQGESVLGGRETVFSRVLAQGKPVVLNFWAGSCPPCRLEMPGFQRVSTEFSGRVTFVGIDVGPFTGLGSHDDAVALYQRLGIHYPLAYAVDGSPLQIYDVQGMPTTVFLTAAGHVADRATGILTEDQLRSEIQQKLLGGS